MSALKHSIFLEPQQLKPYPLNRRIKVQQISTIRKKKLPENLNFPTTALIALQYVRKKTNMKHLN